MADEALYRVLEAGALRLEPIAEHHREPLRAACAEDPAIWTIYPVSYAGAHFDPQFDGLIAGPPAKRVYAVVLADAVVGMTGWLAHNAPGWSIEIGNTYLVPRLRGTGVNARMKRLMLDHAFACGLERVCLKVDARNQRSQAAIRKLGAVLEGVHRHDRVTWTGHVRDTVYFSILRSEWKAAPA
ncbi:GNAT family N-acetyltransferase [Novosphingobium piscinae]|uniref:GNAT family N-acetyltransferase n=1 Tax=Novosphingobium piscinae TaxID=1507448 RepID=A0A7X1FW19_9SPHN|nr:GNAT family protein [Novosphingobium piscinae]MBC2668016.1 GNAT family N-acetyltransferase [Novosphingobium piscinae]